jgi:hypothetical protein
MIWRFKSNSCAATAFSSNARGKHENHAQRDTDHYQCTLRCKTKNNGVVAEFRIPSFHYFT